MHVFEISGLGKAPFSLSKPDETNECFFCEHCGTILKNRYFIKSSDGKVSVVGVDCLNKTGDRGLIDSVKAEKRKKKEKDRLSNIENKIEERKKEISRNSEKQEKKFLMKSKQSLTLSLKKVRKLLKTFLFTMR